MHPQPAATLDLREQGAPRQGQPQALDRRLFMQLLAFTGCPDGRRLAESIQSAELEAVVYEDLHDPRGIALLVLSEDPNVFLDLVRDRLNRPPFAGLTLKPEYTLLGRTYAIGYEPDLEDTLLARPRRTVMNAAWPWAVWYPLRRSGQFARLPDEEQRRILGEHGALGHQFGSADFAHDIRLMCYGLDKHDNDFVVGLVGKELFPLSALVQAMRRTQQTSLYLENLGPFFVGRKIWQSAG